MRLMRPGRPAAAVGDYFKSKLASFVYFDPFGESWLWYRKNSRAVMVPNSGAGSGGEFFLQTLEDTIGAVALLRAR